RAPPHSRLAEPACSEPQSSGLGRGLTKPLGGTHRCTAIRAAGKPSVGGIPAVRRSGALARAGKRRTSPLAIVLFAGRLWPPQTRARSINRRGPPRLAPYLTTLGAVCKAERGKNRNLLEKDNRRDRNLPRKSLTESLPG